MRYPCPTSKAPGELVRCEKNVSREAKFLWRNRAQPSGSCGELTGIKCSFTINPTIKSGDDRKAPIGPHSQVQNASARNTASAFSDSLRPTIVGVTKWPSRKVAAAKQVGAISA